ncbi:MAG: S8 family serine peptidase, partial [Dehalococcoidia bacterium]
MFTMPRIAPRALAFAVLAVLLVAVAAGQRAEASGTLLVGLQPGQSEDALQGSLTATGARVSHRIDQLNLLIVETSFGGTEHTIRRLRDLPAVRYAERDVTLAAAAGPNDTGYLDGKQWNLDRIHAPEAWALVPGDGKTIVAVLDSGVDYNHPDLAGQVLPLGCDQFRTGCVAGDGRAPLDTIGHGTHVAGIIAAKTNNGTGVASVTGGRASILAVRLSARATSSVNGADALRGVVYAVDHGAKVINMSFGGPCGTPQSDPWRDAVSYAHERAVLMVIAAG